jgi:plasmid stability protein
MASITIRNLDDETKRRLRVRAAEHGRSMEDEVRELILQATSSPSGGKKLGTAIRELFAPLGGVELEPYPHEPLRSPPKLD